MNPLIPGSVCMCLIIAKCFVYKIVLDRLATGSCMTRIIHVGVYKTYVHMSVKDFNLQAKNMLRDIAAFFSFLTSLFKSVY